MSPISDYAGGRFDLHFLDYEFRDPTKDKSPDGTPLPCPLQNPDCHKKHFPKYDESECRMRDGNLLGSPVREGAACNQADG